MKIYNKPAKGAAYSHEDFSHLYNATKELYDNFAFLLSESAKPTRITGVETTKDGQSFTITEGWLLYNHNLYKVDSFSGTASGSQIPVFSVVKTAMAHEPHDLYEGYDKAGNFTICEDEKLVASFAASGTALFDYTEIIQNPLQRNSEAIAGLQGLKKDMALPYFGSMSNFDATGKGIGEMIGFALCNGQNGTVDMRGLMLVNASDTNAKNGNDYANDSEVSQLGNVTGRSKIQPTVNQLPSHTHTVSETAHSHTLGNGKKFAAWLDNEANAGSGSSGNEVEEASVSSTDAVKTNVTINSTGNGDPIAIRPPARTVWFVQKIA